MTSSPISIVCLWLGLGLASGAAAATATTPAGEPTGLLTGKLANGSAYDTLWSVPLLYKNEANPLLQELALQGHLQTQYASGSNGRGHFGTYDLSDKCTWDDVDVRRFRVGLRARVLGNWKLHTLFDIYPDLEPRIYKGIAEAYISYAPCDAFNISLGKAELKFTREQEYSSRDHLPFERSQIVNQFYGGELTGMWVSGKGIGGGWLYELGAYGNDRRDEWSEFNAGAIVLAKLGYNYSKASGLDFAQAAIHYLHNTEPGYFVHGCSVPSPSYSDCIALSNDLTNGRLSLVTELFWGDGAMGRPDIYAFTAMPTCYLVPTKLQLVTTFQFAGSHDPNGVCLPTRYEALAPGTGDKAGDAYFAGYAGLNYYFYGQKLKVMSGVKYTHLDGGPGGGNSNGWTWLAGLRSAF
ncbi:MAG: porin [Verrucomicrobiota bacterium]